MTREPSDRLTADLLACFERAADRTKALPDAGQIEAHAGCWLESVVLKLQKRHWSNAAPAGGPSEAGIFFSVWIDEAGRRKKRVLYNIHALKLRSLAGHAIQSREFAAVFRSAFGEAVRDWPRCTVDHGPQTLMQGWIDLDPARLEDEIVMLAGRFLPLAGLIDTLLDGRTIKGSRR